MSSEDRTYGDPATRRRILDVALKLAADLGPAMRLVDVARGAGVSHQGLYLHFRGRDGLLLALLPHMVESFDLHNRHAQVTEAPDGRAAIERMVDLLGFIDGQLDSIGWVLEEAQHLDEAFGEDWRHRVLGLRQTIERDVIARLDEEGALRPEWSVPDATDLMLAVTTLGTWRDLTRELGWRPREYTDNITRLLETSLLRD
ncbi:MAG TPA: TetR/AcrR family transcriptional regulator [Acidimicrobiia bacterium]